MSIIGLSKRSRLCKICNVFDDNTLSEITLDIILKRRSWEQIRTYYSPYLPEGVTPLTDININNHKKHCHPELIADEVLKRQGTYETPADIASKLYAEIFKEGLDKVTILKELYRERLTNLQTLQLMLDAKRKEYLTLENKSASNSTLTLQEKSQLKDLFLQIKTLVKDIDKIQEDLQNVLLREVSIDKGLSHGNINITQNYVNVFQGHLKGFLEEVIPYLLMTVFKDDQSQGRDVVKYISETMDKHLAPAFEESKLLQIPNKKDYESISRSTVYS